MEKYNKYYSGEDLEFLNIKPPSNAFSAQHLQEIISPESNPAFISSESNATLSSMWVEIVWFSSYFFKRTFFYSDKISSNLELLNINIPAGGFSVQYLQTTPTKNSVFHSVCANKSTQPFISSEDSATLRSKWVKFLRFSIDLFLSKIPFQWWNIIRPRISEHKTTIRRISCIWMWFGNIETG